MMISMPPSPFVQHIGMVLEDAGGGWATISLPVEKKLYNSIGITHGGVLCSLADVTGGMAVLGTYDELPLTTDFNISYFKRVKSGKLICVAEIINKSRKSAKVESSIYKNGILIAKASISYSTSKTKHPDPIQVE